MPKDCEIVSGRVRLAPLTEEGAEKMRLLRNRHRDCFVYSGEISAEAQKKWFEAYREKPDDHMFSVFSRESGAWIGAVGLYDVRGDEAEFGRLLIDREAAGTGGFGVDATLAVCRIGFEQLHLQRIVLEVYADNIAAIKTYEKAGFRRFGEAEDTEGRSMLCMELFNMKE